MFCTKCGANIEGSKFCTVCGTPVPAEETAPAPVAEETAAPAEEAVAVPETEPVPEGDICKTCGSALEGRNFCVICGSSADDAPAPVFEPVDEPEPIEEEPEPIVEEMPAEEPAEEPAPAEEPEAVEEPVSGDVCANCGAPLEGRNFCVMCGTKAPVPAEEPAAAEEPVAEEPTPVEEPAPAAEEPVSGDVCANCGAPLEGRSFCIMCGTKAGEAPAPVPVKQDNCPGCGAPLNGKAFCVVCGTSKDGVKPTPPPAPVELCVKCGSPLNGKAFCVVCGTAKNGVKPVQTPVQPFIPVTPAPALKKACSSGKFLVTTIFATLYVLISIFASTRNLGDLINRIMGFTEGVSVSITSTAVSAFILPILIVVGLWITYATAKGSIKVSPAGLSIISVIMLINLIVAWIPFVLTALAGFAFFIPGLIMLISGRSDVFGGFVTTGYGSGGALSAVFIGFGILVGAAIMLLFVLLFYRRLYKFAKSVAKSVKQDKEEFVFAAKVKNWLMFFGIVSVISAAVMVVIGLGVPAEAIFYYGIGNLFAAVATILGSSWIKTNCIVK